MIGAVRVGLIAGGIAFAWLLAHAEPVTSRCVPLVGQPGATVCGGRVDEGIAWAAAAPTMEVVVAEPLPVKATVTEAIPAWMPSTCRELWPIFEQAGHAHRISPTLLSIVSLIESGCGGAAKTSAPNGVIVSSAGAAGVMQIVPATAQGIASNRGLVLPDDWRTNEALQIDYGAWLLAHEMRAYGQDESADPDYVETIRLACIAYNGGGGAVMAYRRGTPYAESLSHSGLVVGMWQERHAKRSPTFERWRDAGGWRWMD